MNTKKLLYGFFTFLILFTAACTSDTTEEDNLYEFGVDKTKIKIPGSQKSVDKTKIKIPGNKESVDKNKIRIPGQKDE